MATTRLHPDELEAPEGEPVVWDAKEGVARSEVYGSLRFVTPLIELPLDRVTRQEQDDYDQFREEYMRLWRRFFDPVGLRLKMEEKQVKMEAYILPLIQSSAYNDLRLLSEGKGTRSGPLPTSSTVGQFLFHINTRGEHGLGDWMAFRLEDSPALREMVERQVWSELTGTNEEKRQSRLFWKLPVTIAIGVTDGPRFRELFNLVAKWVDLIGDKEKEVEYEGVNIRHIPIRKERLKEILPNFKQWLSTNQALAPLAAHLPETDPPATVYSALIDDGYYLSLREDALRRLIDASRARKKRDREEAGLRHASMLLDSTPERAGGTLRLWLEWETHRRALTNNAVWEALIQGHAVRSWAPAREREESAYRLLGFVPVSPDGATYDYDTRAGEASNRRHGSYRAWKLHTDLDERSALRGLLDQVRGVRADLRFREDGIHTTLTMGR
jgi:hypothetical protein